MTPGCDLCGASSRLTFALLREPWSANRVPVRCCTPCAVRAWRTLDVDPPARSFTAPASLPANVLLFRRRAIA